MKIVFVGGTGRCGTSIVRKLFTRHSQITSLSFESRFIIDPNGILDFYGSFTNLWSPYLAHSKLKMLESMLMDVTKYSLFHGTIDKLLTFCKVKKYLTPKRYASWELRKFVPLFDKYVTELIAELEDFSFNGFWYGSESYTPLPRLHYSAPKKREDIAVVLGDFIRKVYGYLLEKENAILYLEDCPFNILFAKGILEILPEAKFLHVARDPRDVVSSFCNSNWAPTNKKQSALYFKDIMERWFVVRDSIPIDCHYEIKLEDLVNKSEATINNVCEFMGLEFEHDMLNVDLSKSNIGRWEKEFTQSEKKMTQNILKDVVEKLGYREWFH